MRFASLAGAARPVWPAERNADSGRGYWRPSKKSFIGPRFASRAARCGGVLPRVANPVYGRHEAGQCHRQQRASRLRRLERWW